MHDLISRQAAIEAIDSLVSTMSVCISTDECRGMNWMKQRAIGAVEVLPSEPRWIPASGTTWPVEGDEVLVCDRDGFYYLATCEVYDDNEWFWSETTEGRYIGNVTAWMPLPEPWRGKDD